MQEPNMWIKFYIDKSNKIHVLNEPFDERSLRKKLNISDSDTLILFMYNVEGATLYATNLDEEKLLGYVESLKNGSVSFETRQLVHASEFLKKKFNWNGETQVGNPLAFSCKELEVKDFLLAHSFISGVLDRFDIMFDAGVVKVLICQGIDNDFFVPRGEVITLGDEEYMGELIVINASSGIFDMNLSVVRVFSQNLLRIIGFDVDVDRKVYEDVQDFMSEMFYNYTSFQNLDSDTYWYLAMCGDDIHVFRNNTRLSRGELMGNLKDCHVVLPFVYNYQKNLIRFSGIRHKDFNRFHLEMYDALMENLDVIEAEEDPVIVFDQDLPFYHLSSVRSIYPAWIFISAFLSKKLGFKPMDVLVLSGEFEFEQAAVLLESRKSEKNKYLSGLDIPEDKYPLILWNRSSLFDESYFSYFNSLIYEYVKCLRHMGKIDDENFVDVTEYYRYMDEGLREDEFVKMVELELLSAIESSVYFGDYNLFKFITEILRFKKKDLVSSMNSEGIDFFEIVDRVQLKMYYVVLNALSKIYTLKYGVKCFDDTVDVSVSDIVKCTEKAYKSSNLLVVESIKYDKDIMGDDNAMGMLVKCRDLVTDKIHTFNTLDGLVKFRLYFEREDMFKSAQKDNSYLTNWEVYREFLSRFLRHPIEKEEVKYDNSSTPFEALLRIRNEQYGDRGYNKDAVYDKLLSDGRVTN